MATGSGTRAFIGGLVSNAVWEWLKAIAGGLVSSVTSAAIQYLRHRPVDWWGVVILGVITALVIGLLLMREHKSGLSISSSQPSKSGSADIFAPLQMEAFMLAKDMADYLEEIGPIPAVRDSDYPNTKDGLFQRVFDQANAESPWRVKLNSKFAMDFAPKVTSLIHKFGLTGKTDTQLQILASAGNTNEQKFEEMRARLVALAHTPDGIILEVPSA